MSDKKQRSYTAQYRSDAAALAKETGKKLRFEYIEKHVKNGEIAMYCRVLY